MNKTKRGGRQSAPRSAQPITPSEQIQRVFEMAGLGSQAARDRFRAFETEPERSQLLDISIRLSNSSS